MNHKKLPYIFIAITFAALPLFAYAQNTTQGTEEPVPYSATARRIDQALQQNRISRDQALLYQFYSVFDPSKLPQQYAHIAGTKPQPVKCFTPVIAEYHRIRSTLSKNTQNIINHYLTAYGNEDDQSYTSPSGKFELYYTVDPDSRDAVPAADSDGNGIPDYVEWAGQYADSTWNREVKEMGFSDPVAADEAPYVIRFARLGNDESPVYGYTQLDMQGHPEMVVHCDFGLDGFPHNTDPDGKVKGDLKVTIAHEFKHGIQFIDDGWSGESARWLEMDATMMEEAVFDTVNDYYNYLKSPDSIFNNPQYTIYPGGYYQVSWAIYFLEKYGIGFWRRVWAHISRTNDSYINSITAVLNQDYHTSFTDAFIESELWHYASGDRSPKDYGFQERMNYPNARVIYQYSEVPKTFSPRLYSNILSANYQEITPASGQGGPVIINLYTSSGEMDVGFLAVFKDGSTKELLHTTHSLDGQIHIQTPWDWQNISHVGVVTANVSSSTPATSRLLAGVNDVLYGDYNEDGYLDPSDVDGILENVAINGDTYADQLVGSDLSGDGTISVYDAALILKKLAGAEKYFRKDHNKDGYGPEADMFTKQQGETEIPGLVPADQVRLQLIKGDTSAAGDNTINLKLSNPGGHHYSSFFIRLSIPSDSMISAVTFDTTGSVWHQARYKTSYDQNIFGLAIAEADSFSTGNLGTIHIKAAVEGDITITVGAVGLDESPDKISVNTLKYHIIPKTTVAVEKPVAQRPYKTELSYNYPNPFNPVTTIGYSLKEKSQVTLEIYNILGQEVTRLVNAVQPAGVYHYQWNASSYSSGTYLYRLVVHSGGQTRVQTRKMLLIK